MTKRNAATIALALVLAADLAWGEAAPRATVRERLDRLEEQLEELSQRVSTTLAPEVGASSEAARRAEERIEDLEERIADLSEELRGVESFSDTLDERTGEAGRRIDELEADTEGLLERAGDEDARPPVSWSDDEGLVLLPRTTGARLSLRGLVWVRYEGIFHDQPSERFTSEFGVPEARVRLQGSILDGLVRTTLEPSFGGGDLRLEDGYVEVRPLQAIAIRLGQTRVPFDVEWATPEPLLPLIGRGQLARSFGHGRDLGIMALGTLARGQFDYGVGLFNGAGAERPNDNYDFLAALRLRYTVLGTASDGWSDLERLARPHLAFGLGFSYDLVDTIAEDGTGRRYNRAEYQITADGILRWYGATLAAAVHYRAVDRGAVAPIVNAYGYFVHAGYQVWPGHLEIVARYAAVDPDVTGLDDHGREVDGGVTLFLRGQLARLTALYGYEFRLPGEEPWQAPRTGHAIRIQAQGMF